MIDALFWVREKLKQDSSLSETMSSLQDSIFLDPNKKLILVTGHRRESFGGGFERICEALRQIASKASLMLKFLYPVHLNPKVHEPVNQACSRVWIMFF